MTTPRIPLCIFICRLLFDLFRDEYASYQCEPQCLLVYRIQRQVTLIAGCLDINSLASKKRAILVKKRDPEPSIHTPDSGLSALVTLNACDRCDHDLRGRQPHGCGRRGHLGRRVNGHGQFLSLIIGHFAQRIFASI
jgi:hypothetical protein